MQRARLLHYLRNPSLIVHALWRRVYVRRHPDHPWWDPAAIELLERILPRHARAFEWGAGRSTTWLAARVASLTSVEHDAGWHARVAQDLAARGVTNVDLRLIATTEVAQDHWRETPYVMAIAEHDALDLVIVDGLYRQHCVARAVTRIASGGLLVVDNARQLQRASDWGVPDGWELIHLSKRRMRDTAIWRAPR